MHYLWHDGKSRRKEDDAQCHWREKAREGQAVVCIEEAGRRDPNKEEKASLIKDLQTYAMHLFASFSKCCSAFVLMCNVFY